MKTKIIPFDLEIAKKIQAGEIEGKIKTKNDRDVDILSFDRKSVSAAHIVALIHITTTEDTVHTYSELGSVFDVVDRDYLNLVLEVPNTEPEFKPFDKVLVRDNDKEIWECALYSHYIKKNNSHIANTMIWQQCIPYDGNQDLVGTTDKPKED